MKWQDFLKKSDVSREDWNTAIKSFIDEGKKLGVPLDVISLLKEAMTTSSSDASAVINTTYGGDEDDENE